MEIAVLSDIHGNHIALQRCIEFALEKKADAFLFLGDYVGELAYPQKTMNLLYDLKNKFPCTFIRGNKEDYWINYRAGGEKGWRDGDSTTGALLYAYRHLTDRDLEFFRSLPIAEKICFPQMPDVTVCHGSPGRVNEKMLPDDEKTLTLMEHADTSLILCGHSHIRLRIVHDGKRVLNPGSVGVPLHSHGQAQFLILHGSEGTWQEEWVSLAYDVERTIKELHESGLDVCAPYWCRVTEKLLRSGEISHGTVLSKAMELCREETGSCSWPKIPEKYWKRAYDYFYSPVRLPL